MFTTRTAGMLVALLIPLVALASIGTIIHTQQPPARVEESRMAPLDWYFAHDHANLDGDGNVVLCQWAPLDWYFAHDHAILDGDGNVLPR